MEDGTILSDNSSIKNATVTFFTALMEATPSTPATDILDAIPTTISAEDNRCLILDPSMEEVHTAAMAIPADSAPSPDGFLGAFFHQLGTILPHIISAEQGAFVKGRSIAENCAFMQEIFRHIDKKVRGGNILIKLDMEKAYDKLDWEFLKAVLRRFSFCGTWIQLVEKC
ncbi:uncharacterized protein LOC131228766 [Magnolia sinica]|uniref:uncharacterized protein LOC131228766 n=1 Tax=Magnolia sinica TaxID=86752 RepID=UPI00265AAC39|nr:uncharacterized protein LOC131228766 [Magnolia sinica]